MVAYSLHRLSISHQTRKENEMKTRPNAPSVCCRCLCFYKCPLEAITDQCPVVQRAKPAEQPFDQEQGVSDARHRQMILALEEDEIPWDAQEGKFGGGEM